MSLSDNIIKSFIGLYLYWFYIRKYIVSTTKLFLLNLPIVIKEPPTNLKLVDFYLNNENYGKLILNLIKQKRFFSFDFNIIIPEIKNKILIVQNH